MQTKQFKRINPEEQKEKQKRLEDLTTLEKAQEVRRRLFTPDENLRGPIRIDPYTNPSLLIEKSDDYQMK